MRGVVSSPTNKNRKATQISQSVLAPSVEETLGILHNTEVPDINKELPAVPAVTSSSDDRETSSSRTESLGVHHLLSHAELPTNSKSITFLDGHMDLEPNVRWVKRLKLSASGTYAYGTQSSEMEEASSRENFSKSFSRIMRCIMTSSEPTTGKYPCPGEAPMALDQAAVLLRNTDSSATEYARKTQDKTRQDETRFNPWIQRWCHQTEVSTKKNLEAPVVCQPQRSNEAFEEYKIGACLQQVLSTETKR